METWRGICVDDELRKGVGSESLSAAYGGVVGRAEMKEVKPNSMRMNCWKGS